MGIWTKLAKVGVKAGAGVVGVNVGGSEATEKAVAAGMKTFLRENRDEIAQVIAAGFMMADEAVKIPDDEEDGR